MRSIRSAALGAVLLAAAAAGCSGGSTSAPQFAYTPSTAAPSTAPTSAPTATVAAAAPPTAAAIPVIAPSAEAIAAVDTSSTPAPAVVAAAAAAGITTTNAIPVVLPSDASGLGGAIAIPLADSSSGAQSSIPAGTTLDQTVTSSTTSDVPALSVARLAQSRGLASETRRPLFFMGLSFSNTVTLARTPQINIAFPQPLPSTNAYYIALYDPLRPTLGWQFGFEGPARTDATCKVSLCFDSKPGPLTFNAFTRYVLAFYAQAAAASAPTPAPTNVATVPPSPTPAPIVANPNPLIFTATGAAAAQTLTLSEAGFTGAFRVVAGPDCSGVVTISGGSPSFTITPQGSGVCRIGIGGDRGQSLIVPVAVTLAPGGAIVIPPSPAPSGAIPAPVPSTAALTVAIAGPIQSQQIVVNGAPGYSGPLYASTGLGGQYANVTPNVWTSPLPATFTVSGTTVGSTQLRVSDNNGGIATVPVTVLDAASRTVTFNSTSTILGSSLSWNTPNEPTISFRAPIVAPGAIGSVAETIAPSNVAVVLPAYTPASGSVRFYGTLTPSVNITANAGATLTYLPAAPLPAGTTPVLSFYDGTAWNQFSLTPSSTQTTSAGITAATFTAYGGRSFTAGTPVGFAISY